MRFEDGRSRQDGAQPRGEGVGVPAGAGRVGPVEGRAFAYGVRLETVANLEELVASLDRPRLLHMYVPQGAPMEQNVDTVRDLLDEEIPTPVVATTQQALVTHRDADSPAAKVLALPHNQFGGDPVHRSDDR